jgi:catechol 2,3-dioxygenase-like lactoylglutathione lyase family enzyme
VKFEQAGLRVRNLERSLRFYTRSLGFRVKARGDTRSWGGGIWVQLEDPRSRRVIELNWYPKNSLFGGRFTVGGGIDHLDFTLGVTSRSSLERVYRRLLAAGARPTGYEPSTTGGWMASVRDPDGIWITVGRQPTAPERRAMAEAVKASRRSQKPSSPA